MKKIIINTFFLILAMTFSSCEKFLEKEYDASLSEEKVFNNPTLTREFLSNIYTNLPDGFGIYGDPQFLGASRDAMTDNAVSYWGLHFYTKIATDAYSASDHPLLGFWGANFNGIRKANQFLKYVDPNNPNNPKPGYSAISNATLPGDDNKLRDRYIAEAKLLRAIFHFELVAYFGDVPILDDKILDMNDQAGMNLSRDKASDVLKWVADQCDEVKDALPFRYASDGNWGRLNGATAYALKSRALLYRASALNNPSNNTAWWQEASLAAKDFMTKNDASVKPFTLFSNYQSGFYVLPHQNNEVIFSRSIWNTNAIEMNLVPPGFAEATGRTNPTQNLVDSYEMTNGKFIDEAGSGYNPQNPYANRDPRLEATIFHHGSVWGRADYNEQRSIDVSQSGADYRGSHGGTFTGYYLKKFVNPDLIFKDRKLFGHGWIMYRYAELLLNYAEAANEASATGAPEDAYQAVDKVRARVNMPALPRGLSKEAFRKRVRNERRVELSFEDHRFFDLRRWKVYEGVTAQSELSKPRYEQVLNLYVASVTVSGGVPTYSGTALNSNLTDVNVPVRVFNTPKNYYFPIPYNETKKAPNLGQNPGW